MKTENLFDIAGKTAMVTGSTGGLGSLFAEGLAEHGCTVILHARTREKLDRQLEKFRAAGYKAYGYVFDVTQGDQVERAVQQISGQAGTIDILVNNAGITLRAPLEDFRDEDWDRVIGTNLTGTYRVSKAVVKGMIEKKAGKIINIGSVQCELARPGIAPYTASKGGIKLLTRGMAADWAKYNIQVNGIGPGYFKTAMTKSLYEDPAFDAWLCNRTPSHRWGEAEELLGALLFLASPDSSYVNGQMIYVDGGLLASV